jgi:hypothetical protein
MPCTVNAAPLRSKQPEPFTLLLSSSRPPKALGLGEEPQWEYHHQHAVKPVVAPPLGEPPTAATPLVHHTVLRHPPQATCNRHHEGAGKRSTELSEEVHHPIA